VSNEVVVAIVGAIGLVLASLIGLASRVILSRLDKAETDRAKTEAEVVAVGDKVYALGERLDGPLSELLVTARALARAEGVADGEQRQRDRQAGATEHES
jgi:hypothetical protein